MAKGGDSLALHYRFPSRRAVFNALRSSAVVIHAACFEVSEAVAPPECCNALRRKDHGLRTVALEVTLIHRLRQRLAKAISHAADPHLRLAVISTRLEADARPTRCGSFHSCVAGGVPGRAKRRRTAANTGN